MHKLTYQGRSYGVYSHGCGVLTLALILGEQRAPLASEDILLAEAADLVQGGRASIIETDNENELKSLAMLKVVSAEVAAALRTSIAQSDFENRNMKGVPESSPHYQTTTADRLAHATNYQPSITAVETPPLADGDAETSPSQEATEADIENAIDEAAPVPAPGQPIDEVFEEEFETAGDPLPLDTPPEGKLMASHNRKGKRR